MLDKLYTLFLHITYFFTILMWGNFSHLTICHMENLSTWQSVMWRNFSTWQIFLHGHCPWCPWQIWGMSRRLNLTDARNPSILIHWQSVCFADLRLFQQFKQNVDKKDWYQNNDENLEDTPGRKVRYVLDNAMRIPPSKMFKKDCVKEKACELF